MQGMNQLVRLLLAALIAIAICSMTSCGGSDTESESGTETAPGANVSTGSSDSNTPIQPPDDDEVPTGNDDEAARESNEIFSVEPIAQPDTTQATAPKDRDEDPSFTIRDPYRFVIEGMLNGKALDSDYFWNGVSDIIILLTTEDMNQSLLVDTASGHPLYYKDFGRHGDELFKISFATTRELPPGSKITLELYDVDIPNFAKWCHEHIKERNTVSEEIYRRRGAVEVGYGHIRGRAEGGEQGTRKEFVFTHDPALWNLIQATNPEKLVQHVFVVPSMKASSSNPEEIHRYRRSGKGKVVGELALRHAAVVPDIPPGTRAGGPNNTADSDGKWVVSGIVLGLAAVVVAVFVLFVLWYCRFLPVPFQRSTQLPGNGSQASS